jgi:TrmH family RNA methyltransferase
MTDLVSSAANPTIKRVRALADRKHRRAAGASVVHGIQPVWQAVEAGFEIETLVVAPAMLRHPSAVDMVREQETAGVRVVRVTDDLFARISDRDGPTGLAAIIRTRVRALDDLVVPDVCTFVVLDRVANPGNLGTIIRTAEAAGTGGVILAGATADPWDPSAIKASMGAVFGTPVAQAGSLDAVFAWAAAHEVAVATTSAKAEHALWHTAYPSRLAVLMGSEGPGLDDADLARGELRISIPMTGTAESLNLAVATGIVLYDIWRYRAALTGPTG